MIPNVDTMIPNAASAPGMSIGGAVVGGTAPSVLFIGAGNVLAQDPTNFTFDDTKFILKIGHSGATTSAYFLNNLPAIYEVSNASGNNWFEGNAGNFTLTGYQNFGTGDLALSSLTTGFQNTAVGTNAAQHLIDGNNNFVFGSGALASSQHDSLNTMIGINCGGTLGIGGAGGGNNTGNFCAGFGALGNAVQGAGNVAIGYAALSNVIGTANANVVIGSGAGANLGITGTTILNNVLIGPNSGRLLGASSNYNTWVGAFQGLSGSPNLNNTITLSTGNADTLLDYAISTVNVWTFGAAGSGQSPTGIHIYNIQDTGALGAPVNYERAILDWSVTANVFRLGTQKGGTGTIRLIAIDGFQKAGAPAATDLPSGTWGLINDTSGNATWLVYNNAGTIRKVQLT